jgi:hypothetical protein
MGILSPKPTPDEPALGSLAREGHRCGRLLFRPGVDRDARIAAFLEKQVALQEWLRNPWEPVELRAFTWGVRGGWDAAEAEGRASA